VPQREPMHDKLTRMSIQSGNVQRRVFHPVKRWMAATLDGKVEGTGAVFEAKFALPWAFSEEAAAENALQRALEAAGVEFTNGDQPGVRLTRAAAARSAEAAGVSKPSAAAKAVRGQTANAPRKKR
jgi:hypothetical protein